MNTSASSSSASSSSASSNSPSHLSPTSNTSNFFHPTTSSSPLNVVTATYPSHAAYWPTVNSYATSSSSQATTNGMHTNQHYSNYATVAAVAAAAQQYPSTFHSLNSASPQQNQAQYTDLKYSPTTSVPFLYGIESCGGILNQLAANATRNTNALLAGTIIKQQSNSNIDESLNPNDSGFLSNDSPTNSNNNNNNTNTETNTGNNATSNNSNNNNNNNNNSNATNGANNNLNNSNNTSATLTSSWNNGC